MAKPNISPLDDEDKKFAWVLISFVATVGGNLTITGSAGTVKAKQSNIIYILIILLFCIFITIP